MMDNFDWQEEQDKQIGALQNGLGALAIIVGAALVGGATGIAYFQGRKAERKEADAKEDQPKLPDSAGQQITITMPNMPDGETLQALVKAAMQQSAKGGEDKTS